MSNETENNKPSPSDLATEEDIHACYRLFFGRTADRDGLNHWRNWISVPGGRPLSDLVDVFLASSEFRGKEIFQRIVGSYVGQPPELVDTGEYFQYVYTDDNAGLINPEILRQHRYEPHVTAAIRQVLKPGMVFLDLGANVGYFSLMAAHLVGPGGRVIAFEPGTDNARLILMSALVNRFDHLDLYPSAVADSETTFLFDMMFGSNGTLSAEVARALSTEEITGLYYRTLVRTVRLDTVLRGLPRLDVVKMDIEGAEYRALAGARHLIDTHRPIIFSEFSPDGLQNVSQVSGETYLAALVDKRYTLSVIELDGRIVACGQDIGQVMRLFEAAKMDHLDLVAHPQPDPPLVGWVRPFVRRYIRRK